MTHSARPHLEKLHEAILLERKHARNLEIQEMERVVREKEELVNILSHFKELAPEDQELAQKIRRENRRNAFLFRSTLGWIRETMEFFGKRSVTSTYSSAASEVPFQVHGRLLSGKI
ncbi:MAG: flagellar protein FlgN [Deltaproteobacteria bacterium]|nr:MAG: flagellar protein FlgN [Deltaproteobacteria bacterium]